MGKLTDEQLEELIRNQLNGQEKETSRDVWPLLAKKVAKQNFLTFGWKHFNLYQVALVSLLSASVIVYYGGTEKSSPIPTIPKDSAATQLQNINNTDNNNLLKKDSS